MKKINWIISYIVTWLLVFLILFWHKAYYQYMPTSYFIDYIKIEMLDFNQEEAQTILSVRNTKRALNTTFSFKTFCLNEKNERETDFSWHFEKEWILLHKTDWIETINIKLQNDFVLPRWECKTNIEVIASFPYWIKRIIWEFESFYIVK